MTPAHPHTPGLLPDVDADELAYRIADILAHTNPVYAVQDGLLELAGILAADAVAIYGRDEPNAMFRLLGTHPGTHGPARDLQPFASFPWGLGQTGAGRYLFIDDARTLRPHANEPQTLGALGVSSCLHLPLSARTHCGGAIHAFWSTSPVGWDDGRIDLCRMIGHALLESVTTLPRR